MLSGDNKEPGLLPGFTFTLSVKENNLGWSLAIPGRLSCDE